MDLRLRKTFQADLPIFFRQQCDEQAARIAAFGPKKRDNQNAVLKKMRRHLADPTIRSRTILLDGAVVGHVCFFYRDGVKPEVTYWVDRRYWGKGIATWALGELLKEVTERPVYAGCASDNIGSRRVLEKCGFRVTGSARAFATGRGCEIDETFLELHRQAVSLPATSSSAA